MTEQIIRALAETAGISPALRLYPKGGASLYPESSATEKDSAGNALRVLKIRARFKGSEPAALFEAAEGACEAFLSDECAERLADIAEISGISVTYPVIESCDGSGAYTVAFTVSLKSRSGLYAKPSSAAGGSAPSGDTDGCGGVGFTYDGGGGNVIEFPDGFFTLEKAEGTEPYAAHFTEENAFRDGAEHISSHIAARRITLHAASAGISPAERRRLYRAFRTGSEGTLYCRAGEDVRRIRCLPEKIVSQTLSGAQKFRITLLCPSPFFEKDKSPLFVLCGTEDLCEFDGLELPEENELELSAIIDRSTTLVTNGGDVAGGCIIRVRVERPSASGIRITQTATGEYISVNGAFTSGDVITFDTRGGYKSIVRSRRGSSQAGEDITHRISQGSEFFTVPLGESRIRISADGGTDGLYAELTFPERYEGI